MVSRRALVNIEDTTMGVLTDPGTSDNREKLFPCGVLKVVVTGREKPCGSRCGPCQVRLFCDGPLCSRGQHLRVLADMP